MNPTVAIVGGGITGLAAAFELANSEPAPRVVILDADARLGGKIRTDRIEDVAVEAGPDWFITRIPHALDLCRTLGLEDHLVEPAVSGACIWTKGRLRQLPPDFVRGIPTSLSRAVKAGLLSPAGAARASLDFILPGPLTGPDVSVASIVKSRLGKEVLNRLVDPLLAASRAGRAEDLGLEAAAPEINEVARKNRSLIRGLWNQLPSQSSAVPPFLGLSGGMERIVERLAMRLEGVEVRTSAPVDAIEPARGGLGRNAEQGGELGRTAEPGDSARWALHVAGGGHIEADSVILAVPAFAAADLLSTVAPDAVGDLRAIEYASAALITLVYPPGAARSELSGSGFLVPSRENKTLVACAWFSNKWPHARPADGGLVLRCFVGRAAGEPALDLDDETLARRVGAEAQIAGGIVGRPRSTRVVRWDRALPQYGVDHFKRIDRIESALAAAPGIAVAGAGYRGSGLPDCIGQGKEAARKALEAAAVRVEP